MRPGPIAAWPVMLGAVLLGAASTLPHVHTEAWWLGILCAGGLTALVWRASCRQAALLGALFGTAWMVAGTWWLFISMHRYGGLPAPLAALAVLALGMGLSVYWALALGLWARWRTGRPVVDCLMFASAWLLVELARGQWFTGFPWVASGYAQIDGPLVAWAPWVGVYGLGAAMALLGAGIVGACAAPSWRARSAWVVAGLGIVILPMVGPVQFTQSTGSMRVSLLQTGVAQDEKFDPGQLARVIGQLQDDLSRARGPLVVAPETAVPLLPQDIPPDIWTELTAPFTASAGQRAALIGLPLTRGERGYTNSVVAWGGEAPEYRYDKHHLVPFGEFIPWGFRWFVDLMHIPLGDFDRGAAVQASWSFAGQRLAPNICYEDLFGEELARRFHDPAGSPTIMVNVSNIAWFGPTVAIDQHLHISRMRTRELQVPMIRSTNTGATAVIDAQARVQAWLPPQERGVLEAAVEGREGLTPYALWAGSWGLLPLWVLGLLGLGLGPALRHLKSGA